VHSLVHTHLQVFSEPSRSVRTPLYKTIYSPDITLYRSDGGVVHGIEGVDAEIESLVGEGKPMNGWKFVVPGEMKLNADFVWAAWGFGPRAEGVVDVKVSFIFSAGFLGSDGIGDLLIWGFRQLGQMGFCWKRLTRGRGMGKLGRGLR
jgi:hypothetical protein